MKRLFTRMLVCLLISICFISTFSLGSPVSADTGISTLSYEDTYFSFKGTCNISYQCTGMFLDVSVNATASNNNNETITLMVYIANRDVIKTYTFYSDGQTHEFNNIFLGFSGGSDVRFTFTGANPDITINVNLKLVS